MKPWTDARPCWCGVGKLHYGQFGIYITCSDVVRYWAERGVTVSPTPKK